MQDGGAVTAGNSSPITDGAAALLVASAAKAAELKLPVLAVLRGYGDANQAPEWFSTAPAAAIPKVCAPGGREARHVPGTPAPAAALLTAATARLPHQALARAGLTQADIDFWEVWWVQRCMGPCCMHASRAERHSHCSACIDAAPGDTHVPLLHLLHRRRHCTTTTDQPGLFSC